MLPTDAHARKERPIARGVLDYFPDAIAEVANCSFVANQQHNPGEEMHWAKEKSADHADCLVRHLMQRGEVDSDGIRHATKVAWRALALLQVELESDVDTTPVGLGADPEHLPKPKFPDCDPPEGFEWTGETLGHPRRANPSF